MAKRGFSPKWDEAIRRAVEFHRQHRGINWSELDPLMPAKDMTSAEIEDFVSLLAEHGVHPTE